MTRASPFFLAVLIAITAAGPFSMQIFLPALPAITGYFAVGAGTAQLTLSLTMIAIALSTLGYGPVADRFGRKPILLGGLVLFLGGSVISATAPIIEILILGRLLQGAGGAAGMVIARAMVRDVYGAENAPKILSYVTMAMVIAPMVAPALGGWLTETWNWRANFVVVAGMVAAILLVVARVLGETRPQETARGGIQDMLRGFGKLSRSRAFATYALQASFSLAVFFAFISAAPYLMTGVMGRPATEYGLWFMAVSGAFVGGSFASARLTPRYGVDAMIRTGILGAAVFIAVATAVFILVPLSPVVLFVPAIFVAFAQGLVIPNAQAGAINSHPEIAGAGSGLVGFLQMVISAGAAQAVGSLENGTPFPMTGFMLGLAVLLLFTLPMARRTAARASGRL